MRDKEMVQVDRTGSASPFWRTTSGTNKSTETKKVIGASYSHADILNLNSLPYSSYFSKSAQDLEAEDDGEDEDEQSLNFEDDEDEFGLPSIASARRKGKRKPVNKGRDPGGTRSTASTQHGSTSSITVPQLLGVDSGDIAEERNGNSIPLYPTAKPSVGKILRPQYKDILKDPANSLHLISNSNPPPTASEKEIQAHSARRNRIDKFKGVLQMSTINLTTLRALAWSGVPTEVRAMTWQLLLGYLPTSSERRVATLDRKRKEYQDAVQQMQRASAASEPAGTSTSRGRGRGLDETLWHQISIDVPRTNPHIELYTYEATKKSLERILYIWAMRHPASGYVQGINDLVTPFWQVFLGSYITDPDIGSGMDPGQLPKTVLDAVEADSFWCLTKLLDGIQDNYVNAQPGIQRQVTNLRDLTTRIDKTLAQHLENEGVEFIQFSFRWMNCLLMREISLKNTIRMWDTYLAEDRGFSDFHLYVCAAFLKKWSDEIIKMEFQDIMMFLQSLPTRDWTEKDIELLVAEAFMWKSLFENGSAHLKGQGTKTGNATVGMGPSY
ncbi:RabGAP/TBC [Saccharata proteae CBS 121410]|uniref:RabGAP/TBC n=1 Tax=Saccharata proteae CBS 121410 TaxID=1314787 RepID=A0A9P4LRP7_9PEZI|nr:RabGAP/TBC [Saccharata proteae CBS 121410]